MNKHFEDDPLHQIDEMEEFAHIQQLPRIRHGPDARRRPWAPRRQTVETQQIRASMADDVDRQDFRFTYQATKLERDWLLSSLGDFYEQEWIDDVLRRLKGGKEASVYQCRASPTTGSAYLAAKVYRPRRFRQLSNDSLYREGRPRLEAGGTLIVDDRMAHAMRKRTRYGKQLLHTSWLEHEYKTLETLHAAGADTPRPYTRRDNAILMNYIGGPGLAAPTLDQVHLEPDEARGLFKRVIHNVEILLAHERVHGDLSAFNILYWEGQITLIDFPQVISPLENRSAFQIFQRDIQRVCDYFQRQGVEADPRALAFDLWTSHGYPTGPPEAIEFFEEGTEANDPG